MAKYQVTYACGHTDTIQLYGKVSDREKRLAYLATIDCPDCYHNKQLQAAKAQTAGLPDLQGSDKQINWATQIRAEVYAALDKYSKLIEADQTAREQGKIVARKMFADFREAMTAHTDCRFWIDNRGNFGTIDLKNFILCVQKILGITDFNTYAQQVLQNQ